MEDKREVICHDRKGDRPDDNPFKGLAEVRDVKNIEWYRQQIEGLKLIVNDADKQERMIARVYIEEKLNMILHCSTGIGFHPTIKKHLGLE